MLVGFMVFNTTFNNISDISWQSVLLMDETDSPEKTIDISHIADKLYHRMVDTSGVGTYRFHCIYIYIQDGPKVGLHLVGMHFTFFLNILLHLYLFVTIIFVQYCLCTFV